MKEIVITYYSRTGKTRWVAEQLAALLEADLDEIREAADRSGALGYMRAGRDAMLKREGTLMSKHSLEGRKVVVLGMPVWAFAPPPAILGYLKAVDMAGRRVCAFCTMDGSGGDRTMSALAEHVPGGLAATLVLKKPLADQPATLQTLREWAQQIR